MDGARLRGAAEAPGLFDRRGRLVLENKRLNEVHKAMLAGMSAGFSADDVMSRASNAVDGIDIDALPKPIARLVLQIRDPSGLGNS